MATTVVGAAAAGGAFASVPYVGWVLAIAAAYVDAAYIAPALAGKGKEAARSPRLLDVPVGSNEPGAPRIWAIGTRIRVPTHVLWQDRKVRESTSGGQKGGTSVQLRRVYIDALVALNDRRTSKLKQLVGNGKLLLFDSPNLVSTTTHEMRADYDGSAYVTLSMESTQAPSFADKFEVDDIVQCYGFVRESGPDGLNGGYWRVMAVRDHEPGSPSEMDLLAQTSQTAASMAYSGGNPFAPATIARIDDVIVGTYEGRSNFVVAAQGMPSGVMFIRSTGTGGSASRKWADYFKVGDLVSMHGVEYTGPIPGITGGVAAGGWTVGDDAPVGGVYVVIGVGVAFAQGTAGSEIITLGISSPAVHPYVPMGFNMYWEPISTTTVVNIEKVVRPQFTTGVFPPGFSPSANFKAGTDTQGEDSFLAAAEGTGNIPAYRGVSYQALDSFFATQFGDQLPYALEALIEVDSGMSWQQAAREVLLRAEIPPEAIDTSGVSTRPFGGMFLRGAVPTITAIQPMLVAGQIIGQERDGTICLFHVDNADVVQIENGASFSDFAARDPSSERTDDKVLVEDVAEEDLPTSVGIRHQDPDNQYSDGYQHFGLRNPAGASHQNEQELDLSNLVLTRKEARNLATTVLRRAWINRRRYRFTLPAAYLHVLENDLMTFTTDDGDIVRCRVIQRDVGADFRVSVTAIAEDVEIEVSGSPVQSAAGITSPSVITPANIVAIPLDMPAVTDASIIPPRLRFAVCATNYGENWAGAQVWESIDGASYVNVGNIPEQTAIGYLDTDLTSQTASEEYGTTTVTVRSQTVDVQFWYEGTAALEAATQAEAEAGKNLVAIISAGATADDSIEIAAFTTVTPNGSGSYTLGGWLRGLRGTSSVQRDIGSIIVLIDGATMWDREFPGQVTPTSLEYKVVPFGLDIDDVTAITVEATWRNSRPLPVRSLTKTIGGSPYDVRFNMEANWTRAVLPPGTQPPHPVDEPVEEYRLDIYDPTGAALVRQKTITASGTGSSTIRDRWFDYPAAEQTADGYTPSGTETFVVDCVQVGEYGDGPSILQEI